MKVMPTCCCSAFSSSCSSLRSFTSSAPSGSSSSSTAGFSTSARASATRCCWPPDSWPACACAKPVQLHHAPAPRRPARGRRASASSARAQAERDVVAHRHVREQRVALEHRVDVAACAAACWPCPRRPAGSRPSVGCSKPAIMRSVVVLPQPDGPSIEKNSPPGICRSMPSTAVNSPNFLTRLISLTSPPATSVSSVGLGVQRYQYGDHTSNAAKSRIVDCLAPCCAARERRARPGSPRPPRSA